MNDFLEMHWGYRMWELAATELLNVVGKEFLDRIDEIINKASLFGSLVASCFSLKGDVLSQWRAYADDGQGYAIGFSATDLNQLPIRPLRVLYRKEDQIKELKATIRALHEVEQSEKVKFGQDFFTECGVLAYDLAAYKNPAFEEEKEIRLLHLLNFEKSGSFLRLFDAGGQSFGKKSKGLPVLFRMRGSIPVPYIEQDFTNRGKTNPIKSVIIGPKNDVRRTAISVFLETVGLSSVEVKNSKASYR